MTPIWDAESVLAASNAWAWVPDDAPHVQCEEYLVVAYPDYFLTPTSARVFGSDRDAAELVDEICAIARGWGRDRLWWRLSEFTRPAGLEPELLARGAGLVDRMDVLALPLAAGVPDLGVPEDVEVRRVTDEQTVRDAIVIGNDAFGGEDPTAEQVASALAEVERGLGDDSSGRWVAYVEGRPAGTGRLHARRRRVPALGWQHARDAARSRRLPRGARDPAGGGARRRGVPRPDPRRRRHVVADPAPHRLHPLRRGAHPRARPAAAP